MNSMNFSTEFEIFLHYKVDFFPFYSLLLDAIRLSPSLALFLKVFIPGRIFFEISSTDYQCLKMTILLCRNIEGKRSNAQKLGPLARYGLSILEFWEFEIM